MTLYLARYSKMRVSKRRRNAHETPYSKMRVAKRRRNFVALAISVAMIGTSPATAFQRPAAVNQYPLHPTRHRSTTPTSTALHSVALPSNTAGPAAFTTLALSAMAGTAADKFQLFGGGAGTIISLLVASLFSNIGLAPSTHPLYDICWSKLLPASLVMMLISGFGSSDDDDVNNNSESSKESIAAVSVPFAIGSIGSVLGCLLSFILSLLFATNAGRWTLPPLEAAVAAGCLCSSYVGGTVNLFATARILGNSLGGNSGMDLESLLSSMAAADLLVMAIYFAAMAAAVKSGALSRIFPGRKRNKNKVVESTTTLNEADYSRRESSADNVVSQVSSNIERELYREIRPAAAIIFASTVAYTVVGISNKFECTVAQKCGIPGMGCAAIAVLSTAIGWALRRIKVVMMPRNNSTSGSSTIRGSNGKVIFPPSWLQNEMDRLCHMLSGICFNLLFAAIGTSANVAVALRHGPASFLFAAYALSVHIGTIIFGSWGAMRLLPRLKIFPLAVEDVMVASNAAIGGPSTAAAFAGSFGCEESKKGGNGGSLGSEESKKGGNSEKGGNGGSLGSQESKKGGNRGLVLAAAVWGVFGYAVGTQIGVGLSGMLLTFVLAEGIWEVPIHP